MKHIINIFLLWLMVGMASCMPPKDDPEPDTGKEQLTQYEWSKIVLDTVPPPSNPLLPPVTDRTVTVQGVLDYSGLVHAPIVASVHCNYYVLCKGHKKVRLDEPMLQEFYIGDTIAVTGEVLSHREAFFYLDMQHAELVGAYWRRVDD